MANTEQDNSGENPLSPEKKVTQFEEAFFREQKFRATSELLQLTDEGIVLLQASPNIDVPRPQLEEIFSTLFFNMKSKLQHGLFGGFYNSRGSFVAPLQHHFITSSLLAAPIIEPPPRKGRHVNAQIDIRKPWSKGSRWPEEKSVAPWSRTDHALYSPLALAFAKIGDAANEDSWITLDVVATHDEVTAKLKADGVSNEQSPISPVEEEYIRQKVGLIGGSTNILWKEQGDKNELAVQLQVPIDPDFSLIGFGGVSDSKIRLDLLPFIPIVPNKWNDPLNSKIIYEWQTQLGKLRFQVNRSTESELLVILKNLHEDIAINRM